MHQTISSTMNIHYAREIGFGRYLWRTLLYKLQTRVLGRDMEMTLPTGVRLNLPRGHAHSAEVYGTKGRVDWGAETLLAEYVGSRGNRSERDFIDVGANIGFYSLLMSPEVRRVHAFEPDPRNLRPLRANAERAANVDVIAQAAAASEGERLFDVSGGHELNHLASADAPGEGLLPVAATTLDACRAALPSGVRVVAVKIDVEGFECEVLDGARELTRRDRPVFLIEFSTGESATNTPERLEGFLQANDYALYAVVRDAEFARTRAAFLRRLEVSALPGVRTKMLFLVPSAELFFAERLGAQAALRPA